jgi:hypothetical protein
MTGHEKGSHKKQKQTRKENTAEKRLQKKLRLSDPQEVVTTQLVVVTQTQDDFLEDSLGVVAVVIDTDPPPAAAVVPQIWDSILPLPHKPPLAAHPNSSYWRSPQSLTTTLHRCNVAVSDCRNRLTTSLFKHSYHVGFPNLHAGPLALIFTVLTALLHFRHRQERQHYILLAEVR